ncbi:hypothetical protein [Pedobacter sp. L105]|uniref:hypothetical protein n=1 Tax=Pedobacter sp. L105 TaxID=1641871 RepID=UPI00131E4A94|nr:hypothetical protein [Pedobacter sp. L105]
MGNFITWLNERFRWNGLYIWTSIWVLFVILFGLIVVYECANKIDTNYAIVVIWAIAYFFFGALLGCIFGVPKGVAKPKIVAPVVGKERSIGGIENSEDQNVLNTPAAKISYNKGNTNLTDISDWLTKIVIGAGLVELNNIPGFMMRVAARMSQGIHLQGIANSQILCAGIIVYYMSFGLIAGYFVMRSILLDLLD